MTHAEVFKLIAETTLGNIDGGRSLRNEIFELDLIVNKDAKWNSKTIDDDDFIFYPYYAEIEPIVNGSDEQEYMQSILDLVIALSKLEIHCVAACDFEDFLKDKIECLGFKSW